MPTHLHAIVSTEGDHSLSDVMRDFKRHTGKKLVEVLKTSGWELPLRAFRKAAQIAGKGNDYKVWDRDFHPQAIVEEEMFRQKVEYIHANPVRKGLVRAPEDWVYSSAGFYLLGE